MKANIIIQLSLLLSLVLIYSCSHEYGCSNFESEIKSACVELDSVYSLPISSLTEFPWNEFYIISGPRFRQEVEEISGCKYDKEISDNSRLFLFIKNDKIVKDFQSNCNELSFFNMNGKGYVKYDSLSNINLMKKEMESVIYYSILEK